MHWSPIKRIALFLLALLPLSAADQMSINCGEQSYPVQVRNYEEVANRTMIYDRTGTYEITYNSDGTIVEILYPNGIETLFIYDDQNRVTDVDHQTDEGITFLSYRYEYDEKGRQTMVQRLFDEEFTNTYYSYTPQGFLARVDYPNGDFEAYTYDEWGNRLTKENQDTFIDYEYDGELLVRAGNTYYTYTEEGYLAEKTSPKDTETFIFDGPFLSQTTNRSGTLTYSYDDAGRRIRKSGDIDVELIPMPPEIFGLRDRVRIPLVVSDNCHYFCYGDGLLASSHPNRTRYYLYNHPDGSVAAVMEEDAVALLEFDPFGMPLSGDSPVGLNGEWFDFETGLYYLSNRYYDPEIGRYISPDFADDHPYIYCYNDPINYVDPLGLWGFGRAGTNEDMMGRGRPRGGKTNSPPPPPPPPPPSRPGPFDPNPRTHKIKKKPKKTKKQTPPPAPAPTTSNTPAQAPPKKETPKAPNPKPSPPTPQPQKNSVLPPTPSQLVNSGGTKTTPQTANPNPITQAPQRPQSKGAPPQTLPSKNRPQSQNPPRHADNSSSSKKKDSPLPSQIPESLHPKHPVGTAAKNAAAFTAHNAIELVDELVFSPLVGLVGDHKTLGAPPNQVPLSVKESYEKDMDTLHRKVDQFLKTDQTNQYTQEAKANRFPDVAMGIAPPPLGSGSGGAATQVGQTARTVGKATSISEEVAAYKQATNIKKVTPTKLAPTETSRDAAQAAKVVPTPPNNTKGWKLGDDIRNLTRDGKVPSWNAVRARYWKNQAFYHPERYKADELKRMKQGKAPQRINKDTGLLESKELHHEPPQREGGLFDFVEIWPEQHAAIDPKRYIGK